MLNLFFSLMLSMSHSETIKVAVIDTGYDFNSSWPQASENGLSIPKLCATGHKSFVGESLEDKQGHGTHIAGLIAKYAKDSDYCLIIYKYYGLPFSLNNLMNSSNAAFRAAIDAKVPIINYSGGGMERDNKECSLVKEALDKGIKVVAAAGNNGSNLLMRPFFPAMCDDRVVVVQNIDSDGILHSSSNYLLLKKNVVSEVGVRSVSLLPHNEIGPLTGTSQATAVVTGKLIKTLESSRRTDERLSKNASK